MIRLFFCQIRWHLQIKIDLNLDLEIRFINNKKERNRKGNGSQLPITDEKNRLGKER